MSSSPNNLNGDWNFPTSIRFGAGRLAELPEACSELGISSPLVVTDPTLAELPLTQRALEYCSAKGLRAALYRGVRPNPVGDDVLRGVAAFRDGDHDGVIAVGGGSAMDVGKAVGLMVGQRQPIWDFEDIGDNYLRVAVEGMVPVVAVPTTSGTGSEVGRCSVISNEAAGRKVIIFHPGMMPGRVICDPELTLGLPPRVTAGVGMDALAHNLEAYCAPGFHPLADGIALEGIRLIHRSLSRAVHQGQDLEARAEMMASATLGATAFQKGLGAMHALSHPVTSLYNTHHGLTNAVVMPYVLQFNREVIEERVVRLSRLLGFGAATFEAFTDWILDLRADIGIPSTLAELGVTEEDIPDLSAAAAVDPTAATNPIAVNPENLASLYAAALHGNLDLSAK